MKMSDKQKKQLKVALICIVVVLIIWFLILSPILKFKKNEKIVNAAGQRYYEINAGQLPTGTKVKTVTLQTLYEKDFISTDLRSSYTGKVCDSRESWVKVQKKNGEYKYYVYLKCGIFSSKVDHKGPDIKLKGEDQITINKDETFKDPGIDSVVDDTDGKMNIKDVIIDSKKLNTKKIGTYEITYKIKDSFNNETVKIRTVKVIETLNHIVEKDTKNTKVYKGIQYNNYVELDGILFKIVGENEDGTVKIASDENLAAVNYEGTEKWLNDYFYNKLSESAKKLIKKSKWCDEKVTDPSKYTECKSYGKKQNVGLLSVADINNSKGDDGNYNLESANITILSNLKNSGKNNVLENTEYYNYDIEENFGIKPTINIIKDTTVIKGNGGSENPYILKGNNKKVEVGNLISEARTGEYIDYSGYTWRVIGKESDGSTKIIMTDILKNSIIPFDEDLTSSYNINKKTNIGYKIKNDFTENISLKYFINKDIEIKIYKKHVGYDSDYTTKTLNTKLILPSIYDLYSASSASDFWYIDYSKTEKQYYQYLEVKGVVHGDNTVSEAGTKIIGYLDSKVKVKKGKGTMGDSYSIIR